MALRQGKAGAEQIESVRVETYPAAIRLAGIARATTPSAARFSIPFSVALALHRGSAAAADFDDASVGDDSIQSLAGRVALHTSPHWESVYPNKRGATVTLTMRGGTVRQASVDLAKGEPESPASWGEIIEKFRANARVVLSEEECCALREAVLDLENRAISDITRLI